MIQNNKPIKVNDYLEQHSEITNLKFIIANAMIESAGDGVGMARTKTKHANSAFEGCTLFTEVTFSDYDYILVGHKCFITLYDDGSEYKATSIYVHPSTRKRGYAKAFMATAFDVDKQIVVDTWVDGLKKVIEANPSMENFTSK